MTSASRFPPMSPVRHPVSGSPPGTPARIGAGSHAGRRAPPGEAPDPLRMRTPGKARPIDCGESTTPPSFSGPGSRQPVEGGAQPPARRPGRYASVCRTDLPALGRRISPAWWARHTIRESPAGRPRKHDPARQPSAWCGGPPGGRDHDRVRAAVRLREPNLRWTTSRLPGPGSRRQAADSIPAPAS